MGYGRIMGFGSKIPANRVGGRDFLWVMAGYGLPRVWVKTGSTVEDKFAALAAMPGTVC